MPTQIGITRIDVLKLRQAAKSAGIPTDSWEYQVPIEQYSVQRGEYFSFFELDAKIGLSMLEAVYPGFRNQSSEVGLKDFAKAIKEAGKCSVNVDLFKFRTGLFKTRWVANVDISQSGFVYEPENKGIWHLRCAGSSTPTGLWKQISDAANLRRALPFAETQQAIFGD